MFCSEAAIATNAAFKTRIASAVFARGFNTASLLQRVLVMRERFSGLGAVGVRSFHEDKLPPAPKQKKKEWTPQTFHAGISDAERKSIMVSMAARGHQDPIHIKMAGFLAGHTICTMSNLVRLGATLDQYSLNFVARVPRLHSILSTGMKTG